MTNERTNGKTDRQTDVKTEIPTIYIHFALLWNPKEGREKFEFLSNPYRGRVCGSYLLIPTPSIQPWWAEFDDYTALTNGNLEFLGVSGPFWAFVGILLVSVQIESSNSIISKHFTLWYISRRYIIVTKRPLLKRVIIS